MTDEPKNGTTKHCAVGEDWHEYKSDLAVTLTELSLNMKTLVQNTEHLHRFGVGLDVIADKITENNEKVLHAAINKEHIPVETVNAMLSQISKNNSKLYSIFGFITVSLVGILGFLLVGEKFEWIRTLY